MKTELRAPTTCPWQARRAWMCILALVICQSIVWASLHVAARHNTDFSHWYKSSVGWAFTLVVQASYFLFFAFWFARPTTSREFSAAAGLVKGISRFGWWAACGAIGIALIDNFGAAQGWTTSSKAISVGSEFSTVMWFLILKSVLLVPCYEEIVTRGFLYRAFRGSYGPLLSIGLIVCFSAYFHWSAVSQSLFTFACLGALWVLLCVVREETGSLWDCFVGHAAFNAMALHLWLPVLVGMGLLACFHGHKWLGEARLRQAKPGN